MGRQVTHYTDEDKRRACVLYLYYGSLRRSSAASDVYKRQVQGWSKDAEWWDEFIEQARDQVEDLILNRNMAVAKLAMDAVLDRIQHGDVKLVKLQDDSGRDVLDETGLPKFGEVRTPISAKELSIISGIANDKMTRMRGKPTSITQSDDMADKLKALEAFGKSIREKQVNVVGEQ